MKQVNAVIASAVVSGLLVVGMLGIGANALSAAPTTAAATTTVPAGLLARPSTRASRRSDGERTRSTSNASDDGQVLFSQ